jgi:hypothetical protein
VRNKNSSTTASAPPEPLQNNGNGSQHYNHVVDGQPKPWFKSNSGYPDEAFMPDPRANPLASQDFAVSMPMPRTEDVLDFSTKSIRRGFVRKVFGILMVQLAVTCGVIALFIFHSGIKSWVRKQPIFIVAVCLAVIILTAITYFGESLRRKFPYNLILLGILTLGYSVVAASISTFYNVDTVLMAAVFTFTICFAIILFSFQTKFKLTMGSGFIVTLLTLGLITAFFFALLETGVLMGKSTSDTDKQFMEAKKNLQLRFALGCLGALVLSLFLIFDFKRIVNGGHKFARSPEEYILAVLGIYVDFILIFIIIVIILGALALDGKGCDNCGGGGYGGYYGHGNCWICCWGYDEHDEEEEERRRRRNEI